jgi:hypothetical protein
MSYVNFADPVQQPTGAGNGAFSNQDLLNVANEFTWATQPYFGSSNQDIICIPSLLNPAIQWCAPKAEQYIEPTWKSVVVPVVVTPPPPIVVCAGTCGTQIPPVIIPPTTTITPEPSMLWFGVLVMIIIIWKTLWRRLTF